MFLSSKIYRYVALVTLLATGTPSHAASTNPWAMPYQQGGSQGNMQGGFNMGGGFSFGGGGQSQQGWQGSSRGGSPIPQYVAPAPVMPQQPAAPPPVVAPQPVPQSQAQQFGVYPPLSDGNSTSKLQQPQPQVAPRAVVPAVPYYGTRPYGYGGSPWGYAPGFNGFNFFPGMGGFNNFGFNFGLGGGLGSGLGNGFVAPGPAYPNYGYPYGAYGVPQYQVRPQGKTN